MCNCNQFTLKKPNDRLLYFQSKISCLKHDNRLCVCTDAYSLKEAKCVPLQNFDAKGESTLTTRLHDSLSAPQFTDMMAC